jgi:hypothetical protein
LIESKEGAARVAVLGAVLRVVVNDTLDNVFGNTVLHEHLNRHDGIILVDVWIS